MGCKFIYYFLSFLSQALQMFLGLNYNTSPPPLTHKCEMGVVLSFFFYQNTGHHHVTTTAPLTHKSKVIYGPLILIIVQLNSN